MHYFLMSLQVVVPIASVRANVAVKKSLLWMHYFLVSLQVVLPIASVRATAAVKKSRLWMDNFHVAHNHLLAGGFLEIAIVAIKIRFGIVFIALVMLCVNSTVDTTYSFNFNIVISVFGGHVICDILSMIRFEITHAALDTFLV